MTNFIKTIITASILISTAFSASAVTLKCTGKATTEKYLVPLYDNDGKLPLEDRVSIETSKESMVVNITSEEIDLDGYVYGIMYTEDNYKNKADGSSTIYRIKDTEITAFKSENGYRTDNYQSTDSWNKGSMGSRTWFKVDRLTGKFSSNLDVIIKSKNGGKDMGDWTSKSIKGTCKIAEALF